MTRNSEGNFPRGELYMGPGGVFGSPLLDSQDCDVDDFMLSLHDSLKSVVDWGVGPGFGFSDVGTAMPVIASFPEWVAHLKEGLGSEVVVQKWLAMNLWGWAGPPDFWGYPFRRSRCIGQKKKWRSTP